VWITGVTSFLLVAVPTSAATPGGVCAGVGLVNDCEVTLFCCVGGELVAGTLLSSLHALIVMHNVAASNVAHWTLRDSRKLFAKCWQYEIKFRVILMHTSNLLRNKGQVDQGPTWPLVNR